ncbi:hypothetical protein MMC16_004262 [Acarospora aff. strigata]|nr:hypothetical protein [Acarospora aff. strigata]
MATEPYQKVGRGGAGNYYSQQDIQSATKSAEDIEAQSQTVTSTGPRAEVLAPPPQEYAHSGRGGAGNFYSPATLHATGTFAISVPGSSTAPTVAGPSVGPVPEDSMASPTATATATSPALTSTQQSTSAGAPTYYGRGGAGNFNLNRSTGVADREKEEEGRKEREKERGRIEEMVRRDVDRGLRRPEGVYLRPGGKALANGEEAV